jgi:hypothetical protein
MDAPMQHGSFGEPMSGGLRGSIAEAARFWEPRRILYNFILFTVLATWFMATWPHFRPALALFPLFQFAVLGLIANVCYSAAYLVDVPVLQAGAGSGWRRGRWILWTAGMLFAILLENYWISDEIYPFVR